MEIIDFHVQVYPGQISGYLPERARSQLRLALTPLSSALHEVRPFFRFLPGGGRDFLEGLSDRVLEKPFLVTESTPADLRHAMAEFNVSSAVLVPDGSRSMNEQVLQESLENPTLIPAVEIDGLIEDPVKRLLELRGRGGKLLKISRESPDALPLPLQIDLVQEASQFRMPLLLRGLTDAEHLMNAAGETPVVLTHLGDGRAEEALDLADRFENLCVLTSRQPVEVIAEAVRRLGSKRVLFASDWPHGGNNIPIGLRRVRDAVRFEMIREEDAENILALNAQRLLEGIHRGSST